MSALLWPRSNTILGSYHLALRRLYTANCLSSSHRFIPSHRDDIEDVEDYHPGGLHPISLGDTFSQKRYKVLHKLGCGGSSTTWLARNPNGQLISLKVMRADMSSKPFDKIPEIDVSGKLSDYIRRTSAPARANIQVLDDHFTVSGPNGTHLCLVTPLAGPSIVSVLHGRICYGRIEGSVRFRKDIARKTSNQIARRLALMHSAGVVHGDLTSSNILFKIKPHVAMWRDEEVALHFGKPKAEKVLTVDESSPAPHAPLRLVAPIDDSALPLSIFQPDDILITDFGQSFSITHPPADYTPATVMHYLSESPEAYFDGRVGPASDIWSLACLLFEIRAGYPLFGDFFGSSGAVLANMPWWSAFESRHLFFDEEGRRKPRLGEDIGETSIKGKLELIGVNGSPPPRAGNGPIMEPFRKKMDAQEIYLFTDLLEKMLRFNGEERPTIDEVISHPWFAFD
ncbi:kinase-like protein [Pholiota conissans]|uniref:non-specific serine/threonine protein kinase n=1 Tax=Pholiota conissans TaxID=109636 RepID=A0A9P6CVK5_9AGAR|nr:kinase-like protein [Pholiota conissans]